MEDIVIVGNGGFAHEIEGTINRINFKQKIYSFLGYVDFDTTKERVIGNDDFLLGYEKPLNVIIAIADAKVRHKLSNLYKQNKYLSFPNIIDPSVIIMDNISLGEGNIICAGSILTVNIRFGNFNIVNLGCTIGHGSVLENYIILNPGVNISGDVVLKENSFIGTGVQILQGKTIGINAIIGAGAVVTTDITHDCTAVGIPAKIIKDRG